MTSRDFCYWLQGYFEIMGLDNSLELKPSQTAAIKKHLALVFKHEIDPSYKDSEELTSIHNTDPGHAVQNYRQGDKDKMIEFFNTGYNSFEAHLKPHRFSGKGATHLEAAVDLAIKLGCNLETQERKLKDIERTLGYY